MLADDRAARAEKHQAAEQRQREAQAPANRSAGDILRNRRRVFRFHLGHFTYILDDVRFFFHVLSIYTEKNSRCAFVFQNLFLCKYLKNA